MTDFTVTRALFDIPPDLIYLDGNSLGVLPKAASARAEQVIREEWGQQLIRAWNTAHWMEQPKRVGNKISQLVGAPDNSIVIGDTLSIKVYQALASALALNPERKIILSDSGNFPTDLYMAQGLAQSLNQGHLLVTPEPEQVEDFLNDQVAVLMLTEVDYRTGRRHDMRRLIEKAHAHGVVTIWDLAHSAGAIPVNLSADNADFAVGCTYKYLNGGPGAPAFIYVAPHLLDKARPALSGWMGHNAPFAFHLDYQPAQDIERMRVGTPAVISSSILEAALDVWKGVNMLELRQRSIELSELFIKEIEAHCPELSLASPRDPEQRGSQVSFRFAHGYAAMQACIAQGVIGDFRAPDIMRFGFTPLYISLEEVKRATEIITQIMRDRTWDKPEYKQRAAVT